MATTDDFVAMAARNNALWCDAICRANGRPGEFHDTCWLNRHGTPRFYPDAITLAGSGAESGFNDVLADLIGVDPGRAWAVKDSFCRLDLSGLGFRPLFEARWILREPPVGSRLQENIPLIRIESETGLASWERAWAGMDGDSEGRAQKRIFRHPLLSDPDIVFAILKQGGAIEGGGILNRGAGMVGVSNVFAHTAFTDAVWQGLADLAARSFPGLPLVGYERESGLEAAVQNGFQPMDPLRIWLRAG